jgi:hypothetical protein
LLGAINVKRSSLFCLSSGEKFYKIATCFLCFAKATGLKGQAVAVAVNVVVPKI